MYRLDGLWSCGLLILAILSITTEAAAESISYSSLPLLTTRAADLTAANGVQATFFSKLSSYGTETMEEFTSTMRGKANPSLTFGASGITATTTYSGVFQVPGLLSVSGLSSLVEQPAAVNDPPWTNMITLSTPVTAFGSYFLQVGDVLADTVTLRFENTLLNTSKDILIGTIGPNALYNNVFYFGVTDTDPFNRITLLPSNSADGIVLDDITVGVALPEPRAFTLLACGILMLLLTRYRIVPRAWKARMA